MFEQLQFPFMNQISYNEKRIYSLNGKMHTLKELSEMANISMSTMKYRLVNRGMSVAKAVSSRRLSPSQAGRLGKSASLLAARI